MPTTPPVWAITIACSRDTRRDDGTGRRVTAVCESKSGVRQTAAACSTSCIVPCAVSTTMPSRLHSAMTCRPSEVSPPWSGDAVWLSPSSLRKKCMQLPDAPTVDFRHSLDSRLEELTAFDGLHDGGGPVPVRRFQIPGLQHTTQPLGAYHAVEEVQAGLRVSPELAWRGVSGGDHVMVRMTADDGAVAGVAGADGGHAPLRRRSARLTLGAERKWTPLESEGMATPITPSTSDASSGDRATAADAGESA